MQLLAPKEQAALTEISKVVEFRRNTVIYPQGGPARFVYNLVFGVAETYALEPGGERRVTGFLFPSDLLGLSENGVYVDTAQALTPVTAYKIPCDALSRLLRQNPDLDVALLCKLCHELRETERHAITTMQNDARARVARFVLWLWRSRRPMLTKGNVVLLPMLRHDIADYLGLSTESVSRALLQLETSHAIRRQGPRRLILQDIAGLARAAGET